jgi:hypothetical protein
MLHFSRGFSIYEHPELRGRDIIEFKNGTILDRATSPVIGHEGKYHGRIWVFHDITEKKSREDMLQQLLMRVLISAPCGHWPRFRPIPRTWSTTRFGSKIWQLA